MATNWCARPVVVEQGEITRLREVYWALERWDTDPTKENLAALAEAKMAANNFFNGDNSTRHAKEHRQCNVCGEKLPLTRWMVCAVCEQKAFGNHDEANRLQSTSKSRYGN